MTPRGHSAERNLIALICTAPSTISVVAATRFDCRTTPVIQAQKQQCSRRQVGAQRIRAQGRVRPWTLL